ncbi:MBL fold metallo-hydrolase [Rothia uropygialis]|uniref:MBL fold metallo-hydrolase n=1 Tax=Kocuria sp. 36 TaxID=1415402 RepID=UPI00101DF1BD|nr:MBL fold metallo-hydrolase [Kocuria sp. 36]
MEEPVKIYPIVSPWGRFGLYSYFIDAPEPAIVDTGVAASPRDGLVPNLEDLGRSIEDVRWILLTHGHVDHLGGAAALREMTRNRAKIVLHRADVPLLRSREAHIQQYIDVRQQYLDDPDGVEEQRSMMDRAISGEIEPDLSVEGGETISLGDVEVTVYSIPGHTAGSVAYVVEDSTAVFVGDAVQVHGAANGFPGYEDPNAYKRSLLCLRDDIRPRTLYLGHPYRTAGGIPYDMELDANQAAHAIQESLEIEAGVRKAVRQYLEGGLVQTDSPYSPFEPVARQLGYTGDPALEPSPFFTTMDGYRRTYESGEL